MLQTLGGWTPDWPATAVYSTTRRLGLQALPPDGNPYRNVAMMGHPVKV